MSEPSRDQELLDFHKRALTEFGDRVCRARPGQWEAPTPCARWRVRELVNHLVVEQLWVPPLLAGATVEEVGDRFDGDRLGGDPLRAWETAAAAAREAFTRPGALERTVHLSYGDALARAYCWEMTVDLTIHAWDLARGIGADERIDEELLAAVYERTAPHADKLAASGLFDPPVPVPADADLLTRTVALFGRRR